MPLCQDIGTGPGLGIVDYFGCITINFFLLWLCLCQVKLGLQFFCPVCLPCDLDSKLQFRIGFSLESIFESKVVLAYFEPPCL